MLRKSVFFIHDSTIMTILSWLIIVFVIGVIARIFFLWNIQTSSIFGIFLAVPVYTLIKSCVSKHVFRYEFMTKLLSELEESFHVDLNRSANNACGIFSAESNNPWNDMFENEWMFGMLFPRVEYLVLGILHASDRLDKNKLIALCNLIESRYCELDLVDQLHTKHMCQQMKKLRELALAKLAKQQRETISAK